MSAAEPAPPQRPAGSLFVKILVGLVVLVAAVLGYGMTLPDNFRIERSATFAAPPAEVFAQVNNFQKWEHWSPWAKLDPNAKNTFEGPESGEGAVFRWDGNSKVGKGAMTVLEARPDERIKLRIDFEKPMKDTGIVEFAFQPQGENTVVTWSMSGQYQNVFGKLFCKLMNMDKVIGKDFEAGLASMKSVVEQKS